MSYSPGNFDRSHGYLQWGGLLPGGEQWTCGLRVAATEGIGLGGDQTDDYNMTDLLDHYSTIIQDFHHDAVMKLSQRATLEFVKFNKIKVDGHYKDLTTNEAIVGPIQGGSSTNHPANQVALVVTLTTAVTRGPAHSGRFYLPMPCFAPGTDGLITTSDATAASERVKTFIEALSDTPGIDVASSPGVVVMSRKAGAPATRRVSGARVGRVLDTQRRRRRSLVEHYADVVVDQGTF